MIPRTAVCAESLYVEHVKPILATHCYSCHSALRQQSGLRLDTAALAIAGGAMGPAVEPGNADDSLLIHMVTGELGIRMPPEHDGEPLSDDQIAVLKRWIEAGAPAPDEPAPPDPRDHWAFQPLTRPAVPDVDDSSWVRNPVDAFLAADHVSLGLLPVEQADKGVLLRRVHLNLTGLPPTRDQMAAFLNDDSPDAYEQAVERLLASPQYGERWARHWMDVWRYSDWSGYRQEVRNSARHIWRWRDWIVESLNADKGYDQMLHEMLAGDEIAPTEPDTLAATGFLVRNWRRYNRNVWLDTTVEHTAKAFLGLTMNCARCHDHKYDPISQAEYFQLRAIFEPHDVRTDRVPGQPDIMHDGLPRAFDRQLDAATYLFERGDETLPDKENPIKPGTPEVLGGQLTVAPVELPLVAYYPVLRDFVLEEDLAQAETAVRQAESALVEAQREVAAAQQRESDAADEAPPDNDNDNAAAEAETNEEKTLAEALAAAESAAKQLATARATRASLRARVDAERARHGLSPKADPDQLAKAAAAAERELALAQAQQQQHAAARQHALAQQALQPGDDATQQALDAAQTKLAEADAALAAAHAALAEPGTEYQPLGEPSPPTSTGRRLAFAKWLTDRKNPLTARVAVNHIWMRHFGEPLVENVFDFGLRSPQVRNQLLLDWLAQELIDNDWQMKPLHRLLVTSNAYRMSSTAAGAHLANLELDPDNLRLWRMNPRRLEAEAIRDALFHTAGTLDLTRGGPDIDRHAALTTPRRSLYFQLAYEKEVSFLNAFDGPSVNECYRRSESVTPQQALALANSEASYDQARLLAQQLREEAAGHSDPDETFIRLAFQQILSREPTSIETDHCREFLAAQAELLRDPDQLTPITGGPATTIPPADDAHQRARENLTHVLFNHNDFVTIR